MSCDLKYSCSIYDVFKWSRLPRYHWRERISVDTYSRFDLFIRLYLRLLRWHSVVFNPSSVLRHVKRARMTANQNFCVCVIKMKNTKGSRKKNDDSDAARKQCSIFHGPVVSKETTCNCTTYCVRRWDEGGMAGEFEFLPSLHTYG